eukprot:scaffold4.g4855.t1
MARRLEPRAALDAPTNRLIAKAGLGWLSNEEIAGLLARAPALLAGAAPELRGAMLSTAAPAAPAAPALFLFDKRATRFFRMDGHRWQLKHAGGPAVECHEKFKVDRVPTLQCYYAASRVDDLKRRTYWRLDDAAAGGGGGGPLYVLVHYRRAPAKSEGEEPPPAEAAVAARLAAALAAEASAAAAPGTPAACRGGAGASPAGSACAGAVGAASEELRQAEAEAEAEEEEAAAAEEEEETGDFASWVPPELTLLPEEAMEEDGWGTAGASAWGDAECALRFVGGGAAAAAPAPWAAGAGAWADAPPPPWPAPGGGAPAAPRPPAGPPAPLSPALPASPAAPLLGGGASPACGPACSPACTPPGDDVLMIERNPLFELAGLGSFTAGPALCSWLEG